MQLINFKTLDYESIDIFNSNILTIVNKKLAKVNEERIDLDLVPKEETILIKSIERYLINRFKELLPKVTGKEFCSFENLTIRSYTDNETVPFYTSKFLISKESFKLKNNRFITPIIFAFHIRPVNKFLNDVYIKLEMTRLMPRSILLSGYRECELGGDYNKIFSKSFVPGWKNPSIFFNDTISNLAWINLNNEQMRYSTTEDVKFCDNILKERDKDVIGDTLEPMWKAYLEIKRKKILVVNSKLRIYNNS